MGSEVSCAFLTDSGYLRFYHFYFDPDIYHISPAACQILVIVLKFFLVMVCV